MYNTPTPYDALIRSIKRKCKWTLALTTIVCIAILLFGSGMEFSLNGEVIFSYEGISIVWCVVLILFAFLVGALVYGSAMLPLTTSLTVECDPEKYLILNHHLNKSKYIDIIYSNAYLYLGNFPLALEYANRFLASPKGEMQLSALSNKALTEFMMGNVEELKETITRYAALLPAVKLSQKKTALYQKIYANIHYFYCVATIDVEKTKAAEPLVPYDPNTKSAAGLLHYAQGIAAYQRAENEAATYHFMTVKNEMPKTVFARLADDYLALLH